MYDSFRAELEEKAEKIAHMDVGHIEDVDGKLFVEFIGNDAPGVSFAHDHGYELLGVLDEEQAAEHGVPEGYKIAIFED